MTTTADPRRAGRRLARAAVLWAALGPGTAAAADALEGAPPIDLVGAWTAGERAAIAAAIARLPAEIRTRAPRRVARDGIGCDDQGWPADDRDLVDSGGTVHLCAAAAPPAPRAGADAHDTARRLALALLIGFDRAAGWSAEPAWRRLNRWHPSLVAGLAQRSDNQDPAAFADARGGRSPAWDLATFLAALWLEPAGEDGGIGCRLMSQAAFTRARLRAPPPAARCAAFEDWADLDHLAEVQVVLAAPSTAMLGSLFGHLFLRLDYRDGGAGDGGPEDLAGDRGDPAPQLARTVAFLADNDVPFTEDPGYALKGIFGRYSASLHQRSFLDAYRDYVVVEARDLRRWRLDLDPAERRALLERIWTVAHGGRFAYYFFRRNCATLMVDLIDDVRAAAARLPAPGLLAAPPATTLEPWAQAAGAGGRPLLQFVPEPIWSFDHQARAAAQHRDQLERALLGALPRAQVAGVARALAGTHSADGTARAAAYDRMALLLAPARAGDGGDLRAWLRDSATIEMRLSTLANLEAEARSEHLRRQRVDGAAEQLAAELARTAAQLAHSREAPRAALGARLDQAIRQLAAFDPTTRLAGYRALLPILAELLADPAAGPALAGRVRLLALWQSERRYDVLRMKGVPHLRDQLLFPDPDRPIDRQPYLAGQEDLLRLPSETRISPSLRALQRARQALFAARRLDAIDGPAAQDGGSGGARQPGGGGQPDLASVQREYDASLPHSGIDRLSVAVGQSFGAAPPRPGLLLGGALYDEQLGDHHRFGFPSDTALVVARSSLFLTVAGGRPAIDAYAGRLFGYRSLRAPLPESGAGRWPLGWEVWGDLEGDRARRLATAATLGWGLLAPIAHRDDLNDHGLGGLALTYTAGFPGERARAQPAGAGTIHALATSLSLELRAGLGRAPRYRSAVAARLWIEPTALLAAQRLQVVAAGGARLEAHLALRPSPRPVTEGHDPALVVRAQLSRTPVTFAGGPAAIVALISAGVDLR